MRKAVKASSEAQKLTGAANEEKLYQCVTLLVTASTCEGLSSNLCLLSLSEERRMAVSCACGLCTSSCLPSLDLSGAVARLSLSSGLGGVAHL